MSIVKEVETNIKNHIIKAGYNVDNVILEPTSRKDLGEYQINTAFSLGKENHCNPRLVAENIVKELETDSNFKNINIAGPGFINISFTDEFYLNSMNKMLENIETNIDKSNSKLIFMDYGGANIAKTLHVGHLRSADIGEAIKRLTTTLGYKVISDVHFGDIGRQSGMVIYEMHERYPDLVYFKEDYNGEDEELPITEKDLQEIYPCASNKAKENEQIMEKVHEITIQIENGHKGYTALWNKIKELSIKDIKSIYKRLNTTFDLYEGETDCYPYIPKVIEILKDKHLLYESEGAMVVDVKEETDTEPMPPLVVLKANGGTVYQTRELATLLSREERFHPDEIWYFTDNRQELYFKQVFRVAKKAGIVPETTELKFFGFGTMNGSDGKPFKTRAGGVMNLTDLMNMVKEITASKINTDLVREEDKDETSEKISIAALKYADLLPFRSKDFIFDVSKFADLDGKTGPYLLYSTVRIKSLLEKSNEDLSNLKLKVITTETEKEVMRTLLELPTILNSSFESKSVNDITDYLYRLTSSYNKFYSENHILTCSDNAQKESWLALSKLVRNTNLLLLNILAIEVPEKM